jgi:hypothetical protein
MLGSPAVEISEDWLAFAEQGECSRMFQEYLQVKKTKIFIANPG